MVEEMPFISFFADQQDAEILLQWLNSEDEIAFIVPDSYQAPQRNWKVVRTIDSFKDGEYSLWHIAGSLPVLTNIDSRQVIFDPWEDWTERGTGANSTTPYFGPGHPAEIRLELWLRHHPYSDTEKTTLPMLVSWWMGDEDLLPASSFQWIGNRYQPAPQETWRWWRRLKALVARKAIRLTPPEVRWSFWAFPSAFRKLKNGMTYYSQGWDLTEAIRVAEAPEV